MPAGIQPREPNSRVDTSNSPDGLIGVQAQCFGADVTVHINITIEQSEQLRRDLEIRERTARSLIRQASDK